MTDRFLIRTAYEEDWQEAMGVAWITFLEFEGDVYTPTGIDNFNNFITDGSLYKMFLHGEYQMFCAFDTQDMKNGKARLIGLITLRNVSHISLLFVAKKYHHLGIGTALINYIRNYLLSEVGCYRVTVNAAPYGVEFYHKLGFSDLDHEHTDHGIRYTPMELYL